MAKKATRRPTKTLTDPKKGEFYIPQANGLTVLAGKVAGAFAAWENSGGVIVDMCKAVQNLYRGKDIPDDDMEFLCDEVSRVRGWSAASAGKRKLECKAILRNYAQLPEAVERATKKKNVPFTAALALARMLGKGLTPNQAATAYIKGNAATKASPPASRTKEDAAKSIKIHVKRILEFTQYDRKFRSELRALCDEFGIEV